MLRLRVRAHEFSFAASAYRLNLAEMNVFHMASVAIFLENAHASRPRALHFLLIAKHDGETQVWVAFG
jgi:hypothetical protein